MIRKRPDKGFPGRLAARLGAGLLLAALGPGPARPGLPRDAAGWEVRLTVSVQGRYSLEGAGPRVFGEYACRARFVGRLDPDDGDFVLVHLRTEALDWHLRERAGRGGTAGAREAGKDAAPALRLNYVLREKREIVLDFDFGTLDLPLHEHPAAFRLELPRSPGSPAYDGAVSGGSNRVALPASDLGRRRPERTFAWSWGREERVIGASGAWVVSQSHTADVAVSLVRG
ncbi:MAG TPA: hypothetical protein PLP83_02895 [Candidatus Aminicenantes bacterium]|nr:hypothetical protein [Candidatus Aminicenantes bacterium]